MCSYLGLNKIKAHHLQSFNILSVFKTKVSEQGTDHESARLIFLMISQFFQYLVSLMHFKTSF